MRNGMNRVSLNRTSAILLCCAGLLLSPAITFAQDDETPEQKKLLQTIEEREKIAEEERMGSDTYVSPEDDLMYAKEKDRANRIREERTEWIGY